MAVPPLLMDASRTLARTRLPAPTGIDRVENAYINWAMSHDAHFLVNFRRKQRLYDIVGFRRLMADLDGIPPAMPLKEGLSARFRRTLRSRRLSRLAAHHQTASVAEPVKNAERLTALVRQALPAGGCYLNVGHDNLSNAVMTALGDAGLRRAVLIHDTIPLDFPEFARQGSPAIFRRKLDAVAIADALIFNSEHTGQCARHHVHAAPRLSCVAPLGIETADVIQDGGAEPYFLCVGTIEPRKNHGLLLDVWEGRYGPPPPIALRIAGRRGWNNEPVFRRLDGGDPIGRTVFEEGTPGDTALQKLICGARAVLLPSFAEGYGLPVAEALAAGVPVIASDLPALRAVGGRVPEWLPADDPMSWYHMLWDYADEGSKSRKAQIDRMTGWSVPTWEAHFKIVENALETIMVQAPERA